MKIGAWFSFVIWALLKGSLCSALPPNQVLPRTHDWGRLLPSAPNNRSLDFNIKSLSNKLKQLEEEKLTCIKIEGINPEGFSYCCGAGYSKIGNSFLNQYKIIEAQFNKELIRSFKTACETDQEPCDELIFFATQVIPEKKNMFPEIQQKAMEIKNFKGVNWEYLEIAIQNLKENYRTFMISRAIITSFLFDTVHGISNYIKASGVAEGFDYETFDPTEVLDLIGVIDKDEFQAANFNPNDFAQVIADADPSNDSFADEQTLQVTKSESSVSQVYGISTANVSETLNTKDKRSLKIAPAANLKLQNLRNALSLEEKLKYVESKVDAITYPILEKSKKEEINAKTPNFNKGLLNEVDARNKIQYYIGHGKIQESQVDFTKMPSEALKDIQKKKLLIDS